MAVKRSAKIGVKYFFFNTIFFIFLFFFSPLNIQYVMPTLRTDLMNIWC